MSKYDQFKKYPNRSETMTPSDSKGIERPEYKFRFDANREEYLVIRDKFDFLIEQTDGENFVCYFKCRAACDGALDRIDRLVGPSVA